MKIANDTYQIETNNYECAAYHQDGRWDSCLLSEMDGVTWSKHIAVSKHINQPAIRNF